MKKRPKTVNPEWDILYPLLIAKWRKLMELPLGPEDRLQTREFQSLIKSLLEYRESKSLSSKEALGAYLMYEWPIQYAEALSLFKELPKRPLKVLELGAASAPYSLAAAQHGATEIFALDTQEIALKHGADICGNLGYPISIRTGDPKNVRGFPGTGKWDLIVLSHSLFTMFPSEGEQINYIQWLLPLLESDGHLLIVESSATEVNRKFLSLRDRIAELKIPIAAPCLWKGNCPALKHGSSPCFAQRPLEKHPMLKDIQRACQINLSSLKMSYILLRSLESPPAPLEDNLYRVVSPPVETFKGQRFFLCGVKGKKTLGSSLKIHPKESRAFEYLQRGDVIAINNPSEIDNDMQITEKTEILLHAPCGKPLPS